MRLPLDTIHITGEFKEKAVPGTGLTDSAGVARHIGVDFRAAIGTPTYAPGDGVVTQSYTAGSGNQIIEIRIGSYLWRFLHLSERKVSAGQTVKEGQLIAKSGNTGGVAPHLHVDVRKDGTAWNASLNNYVDPRSLITQGGNEVNDTFKNEAEVKPFYMVLRGNEATLKERQGWVGKRKIDFILSPNSHTEARNNAAAREGAISERDAARTEAAQLRSENQNLKAQLQNKPNTPSDPASEADKADAADWREYKRLHKELLS